MGDEFEYEKSIESSTLVASNYKTILHLPTIKKQIRNLFTESRDPAWHKRELRLKKKLGKKESKSLRNRASERKMVRLNRSVQVEETLARKKGRREAGQESARGEQKPGSTTQEPPTPPPTRVEK